MKIYNLPYWAYKRTIPNLCEDKRFTDLKTKVLNASCAPTAAANIISYLAHTNRARLLPPQGNYSKAYIHTKLIETLIKNMNTGEQGTFDYDIIAGFEKYVLDRGYKIKISCEGKSFPKKYVKSSSVNPQWVMQGTLGPSNAILGTVRYKYNPKSDSYKKLGGHAITVAGFNMAYSELFIRDPASSKKNIICELINLKDIRPSNRDGGYYLRRYDDGKQIDVIEDAICFEVYPK